MEVKDVLTYKRTTHNAHNTEQEIYTCAQKRLWKWLKKEKILTEWSPRTEHLQHLIERVLEEAQ